MGFSTACYSDEVQKETKARWAKLSAAEKDSRKQGAINRAKNEAVGRAAASKQTAAGLLDAKTLAFMFLWTILACGGAFRLGSGEDLSGD